VKSPQLSFSRRVRAPQKEVWALLTDTESWPVWSPAITAVECAEGIIGRRTRGRIRTTVGLWVPFEITELAPPPAARWSWKVGPVPAITHRVVADPTHRSWSTVTFDLPAWAAAYAPMCVAALARIASLVEDPDLVPGGTADLPAS